MHYVYIIKSLSIPEELYVGYTLDPQQRLLDHNYGKSPHTSKFTPWEFEVVIGFKNKYVALEFETYLKSHSGRAFSVKRFFNK